MDFLNKLTSTQYFGIVISIYCYEAGVAINKKLQSSLANPLMIAIILIIALLKVSGISYSDYNLGGSVITLFMAPATTALAVPVFNKLKELRENLLSVLIGTAVGSATSIFSVVFLCKLFRFDQIWINSLLPKSVTTPFALQISRQIGGIPSVTVAAVIMTGIIGATLSPVLIRLFQVKNPVEVGLAIGTCSHAVGTTKALEIGETEGSISGLAIGVAGIMTAVFTSLLPI